MLAATTGRSRRRSFISPGYDRGVHPVEVREALGHRARTPPERQAPARRARASRDHRCRRARDAEPFACRSRARDRGPHPPADAMILPAARAMRARCNRLAVEQTTGALRASHSRDARSHRETPSNPTRARPATRARRPSIVGVRCSSAVGAFARAKQHIRGVKPPRGEAESF